MADWLIGIDAGGTMTKAALFDADGRERACERFPNQMLFPAPGHTERDADVMWGAAASAVRLLLERTGIAPSAIAGVATAGYGSGLYVVDAAGNPLRPGIVSTDTRATALVERWRQDGRFARNAPRVQQRLWCGHSLALMAWLAEHEPDLVARAHSVLFCKDFLRGRLTGELSTDPTDGGISGLMDNVSRRWATDVMDDLGLGVWRGRMPDIGPSEAVAGAVTAEAARQTGLLPGTPVVRGLVDVTAASVASGITDARQLAVIAGTFSINQTLHATPRMEYLPFLQSPYPIGGLYLATEGAATSAGNLEWFCKSVLTAGMRAELGSRSIYDVCNEAVAASLDRANDILFLPYLFGGPDGAPAGFIGLSAGHQFGDVVRAIYEGIAFAHKVDIDLLLSGRDAAQPEVIRLAGGAARSDVWAQIFADVLERPVELTEGSELGALGTAISAAVGLGLQPDYETAVRAMVRVKQRFEPQAGRFPALRDKYARFRAATTAMSSLWRAPQPAAPSAAAAAA